MSADFLEYLEISTKFKEIVDFIKNIQQIEFKGNNIDEEFAKFYEIANKIEDKVHTMKA